MSLNTPFSLASVIFEILFETSEGVYVPIPAQDHLESLEVRLVHDGAWTGSVVLFDRIGGALEDLFIATGSQRHISIRWGWDNGLGVKQYPQYLGFVNKYIPAVSPEGIRLTIEFYAAPWVDPLLDKETQPRSWPAGKKASEIFADIANKWGWKIVDRLGRPTIEESFGVLPEMSMADESDLKFIREILLPRAVNENKSAFRFFFARDAVHFHSPQWVERSAVVYTFARNAAGDVISFSPSDNNMFSAIMGGRSAQYEAVDSAEGTRRESDTTDEGPVEGGRSVVDQDSVAYEELGDKVKAKVPVVARDPDALIQQIAHKRQQLRENTYTAQLEVRGTHAMLPMEFVTVNYYTSYGRLYYLSGTFRAKIIEHQVDSGGWKTTVELYREGVRPPEPDTPKQEPDQVVTPKPDENTQDAEQAPKQLATGRVTVPGTVTKPINVRGG